MAAMLAACKHCLTTAQALLVLSLSYYMTTVTCSGAACTTAAAIKYCTAHPSVRLIGLASTRCTKFYNCAGSQSRCQACGPGTVFNNRALACDWPSNINTATCSPKGAKPPPVNPTPPKKPTRGYSVTYSQFSCVFLKDADIDGNTNTKAVVKKHWGFFQQAMAARKYKFSSILEAAAFFGHIKHEYGGALEVMTEYCSRPSQGKSCLTAYDSSNWCGARYPKTLHYFGRGPIQLSYPCNYKAMGEKLGVDLLNSPGLVADRSKNIGWQTAVGFWTIADFNCNGRCGGLAASGKFGATTKLINPPECGNQGGRQGARVSRYQQIRTTCFGLPRETDNTLLYC